MKTLCFLLAVVASLFASLPSLAAGAVAEGPAQVAEKFYAGYVAQVDANKDTKAWVANSKRVTAKFKKAYAKAMNAEATVVLAASYGGTEKHKITAKLVKVDGVWLLDAVE